MSLASWIIQGYLLIADLALKSNLAVQSKEVEFAGNKSLLKTTREGNIFKRFLPSLTGNITAFRSL